MERENAKVAGPVSRNKRADSLNGYQDVLDKGLATVGMRDIMAGASLAPGGFYRHFRSKDQLIAAASRKLGKIIRTGRLPNRMLYLLVTASNVSSANPALSLLEERRPQVKEIKLLTTCCFMLSGSRRGSGTAVLAAG